MPTLILGSASPRRRQLLAQIGIVPDETRSADIDETPQHQEPPGDYVSRMAHEKAETIPLGADELLLTADTTVSAGRRILGKPVDADDARRHLRLLSGRRHRVMTAICVRRGERLWTRRVDSLVRFRPLAAQEVESYIMSDEWRGKAGGYAIQGRAAAFVAWMSGSYSAIVGLPLSETVLLLRAAGYTPPEPT